jgi:hypothetical protein
MVTETDRFGFPVLGESESKETPIINNKKVDRFGFPIEVDKPIGTNNKFNSTSRTPKDDNEGFFEKYIADPITAGAAGVGEGAIKLAEGTWCRNRLNEKSRKIL